ncbi:MAG TPA: helix-turn-helix domain-containing protein [Planctomycetota bacterium]|nr:helix-turn-helix domain-containing protein [Planctomycetota bacterium]
MTGDELREARTARNLSTQLVADLVGVHRNTVVRWEKTGNIPGPAHQSLLWILNESTPVPTTRPPKRSRKIAARLNAQNDKAAER